MFFSPSLFFIHVYVLNVLSSISSFNNIVQLTKERLLQIIPGREEYPQLNSDADESKESEDGWLKHTEFARSFFFF